MDPLMVSALVTQGMRIFADIQDRNAKGEVTDADVAALTAMLHAHIDSFAALLAAPKAP